MDKIAELIKAGRLREVADARDLTDLNGLKISLELRRGVDPDMVMQKLYKLTPLEDTFGCNFNVLVGGMPPGYGRARDTGRVAGFPHRVHQTQAVL